MFCRPTAMANVLGSDSNLARELHTWAISSMHFTAKGISDPGKVPSVDEFKV